jgi:lysophospholipase L1-like esterase
MCRRIEDFLSEGQPEVAVIFAGNCDAERAIDPAEIERNITYAVSWLKEHGVRKIVLMTPGLLNLPKIPAYMPLVSDWSASISGVRAAFRHVADRHGALLVDLAAHLSDRLARGEDPDFSRVPYRQSQSWHAFVEDGHYNAYGHRLIAEAFLEATAHWRPPRERRRVRGRLAWRLSRVARKTASDRQDAATRTPRGGAQAGAAAVEPLRWHAEQPVRQHAEATCRR